jgi:hypothetical protein
VIFPTPVLVRLPAVFCTVAVFGHIHCVYSCWSATVDSITEPAIPLLNELKPINDRRIIGECVANFKNPHHMVGHISHVNSELLSIFAVFSRNFERHLLLLLCSRTTRYQQPW